MAAYGRYGREPFDWEVRNFLQELFDEDAMHLQWPFRLEIGSIEKSGNEWTAKVNCSNSSVPVGTFAMRLGEAERAFERYWSGDVTRRLRCKVA